MGFYSPSALVQDARRHDVVVLPVDVNRSHRDHLLVAGAAHDRAAFADGSNRQPAVRLGLRLVRSLSAGGIAQVLTARETGGPFGTIAELVARTGIDRRDLEALVGAGALVKVAGHRHRAQWQALGTERLPGLLAGASADEPDQPDTLPLPFPTEGEDLIAGQFEDLSGLLETLGTGAGGGWGRRLGTGDGWVLVAAARAAPFVRSRGQGVLRDAPQRDVQARSRGHRRLFGGVSRRNAADSSSARARASG